MINKLKQNQYPKVWSFDIDGVLNDYPEVWLHYIHKETSERFISKEEAKSSLGESYWHIKESYRISDYKYQVPIKPDAKYLISRLKERGDKILIATTRPFDKYSLMRKRTKKWLESNNIYFESLVNKEELYKEDFDIHIDDELGDILKIKSYAESKGYILFSQDTIDSKLEGIEVVSSLREIIK